MLKDSMVSIELNSSKFRIFTEDRLSTEMGSPSFDQSSLSGESPRATVQVNVVRSPCCKLDGAEKGTTLGATEMNEMQYK